jgi:hypothetical protein
MIGTVVLDIVMHKMVDKQPAYRFIRRANKPYQDAARKNYNEIIWVNIHLLFLPRL